MPIMTAVFDVPDEVWEKNPFDIETQFGKAAIIAKGDLTQDVERLTDEVERMKSALQTIERMQTYPAHSINTVTLCAARAIAREGLGVPKE